MQTSCNPNVNASIQFNFVLILIPYYLRIYQYVTIHFFIYFIHLTPPHIEHKAMVHVCFYDEEIISNHCLVQQIQLVAKIIGVNCEVSTSI